MSDGHQPRLTVHRLRVTLLDVSPPVWRTIRVPSGISLALLHTVLQLAFGWEDRHLHEWRVGEAVYAAPDEEDWGDDTLPENEAILGEVAGGDSLFRYVYDLGDGWEHAVEVVAVEPYDAAQPPIEVLEGERAAPPEDSGGPDGYEHLLDALADPSDPEHDEVREWVGDWFDPEEFDRMAVNRRLEPLWRL